MKPVSRVEFLKVTARGGALFGLLGLCSVLASRVSQADCTSMCNGCPKLDRCALKKTPAADAQPSVKNKVYECTERCGRCDQHIGGKCAIGLK